MRKNSLKRGHVFEVKVEKLDLSSVHINGVFSIESIPVCVFSKVPSSGHMSEVTVIGIFSFVCKPLHVNHQEVCIIHLESLSRFINNDDVCFVFEVDFMLELNVKTCIWR